jgi:hypothetical protein
MKIGTENNGSQVGPENSKWRRVKNLTKEAILSSTIHGLPNLVRTEFTTLKLFWMTCFLCSAAYGIGAVVLMVIAYFRYETVTNIETIHEIPSVFPAISTRIFNLS